MKHTFAKKALLLGAVLVGLSAGPLQAISNPFAGWTQEGMQRQLKSSMNRLDKEMKDVYRCIKSGGTKCAGHRTEVFSLITTILALVGALKVASLPEQYEWAKLKTEQKPAEFISPWKTTAAAPYHKVKEGVRAGKAYADTKAGEAGTYLRGTRTFQKGQELYGKIPSWKKQTQ